MATQLIKAVIKLNVGDTFTGKYLETELKDQVVKSTGEIKTRPWAILERDDGRAFRLSITAQLEDVFAELKPGSHVRITRCDEDAVSTAGMKVKQFTAELLEESEVQSSKKQSKKGA